MDCLFCAIAKKEIPSTVVYEDENMLAFKDINPQTPVHILIIPKMHIESADGINESNSFVVAKIFEKIPSVAACAGLKNGYRIISNCGPDAAQSVKHLHFHIMGGVKMPEKMC